MGLRFVGARALSALSTWGLKNVFRRPAANFPGKIALYADPALLAHLRPRLSAGSILVVGTNGKTTCTNLLADAAERAGMEVVCNRTGANLDSGVATALLHTKSANWGVFETDELWLAKILPFLQSNYVLLLNLFRDQLDRVGEIDHIQGSIVSALEKSPDTVLIYNADDPLCQAIADRCPNKTVAFGIGQDLGLDQNTVADAHICQQCSSLLEYDYRQYGQLGSYRCPRCGFSRAHLDYAAEHVVVDETGLSFGVQGTCALDHIAAPFSGVYMVYNLLAVYVAAQALGVSAGILNETIETFDPKNGRLQAYDIAGMPTLLNLAKNPTGFNQNLKLITQGEGKKVVAFFINDKEADGKDVSWLWDIDFQELSRIEGLVAFAGGARKHDMQVRLKYAGVESRLVESASEVLSHAASERPDARVYLIANYTALPAVKADLDRLAQADCSLDQIAQAHPMQPRPARIPAPAENEEVRPLVIAHMFPDLLNLYGDGGNVAVLAQRLKRRGLPVRVVRVERPDDLDFSQVDIVFLGGGPDREQRLASDGLLAMRDDLAAYIEDGGVALAICGGYQIAGSTWLMGDESVAGLSLLDVETKRAEGGSHNRLIGDVVLDTAWARTPVVGYENHAGRTYPAAGLAPFGTVRAQVGNGNNDADRADGAVYRNMLGTYLHGPLLSKNPEVADELLRRAYERRARLDGTGEVRLAEIDDAAELAANEFMRRRLGAL